MEFLLAFINQGKMKTMSALFNLQPNSIHHYKKFVNGLKVGLSPKVIKG